MTPIDSSEGRRWDAHSGAGSAFVERPWWALANLVEKIWLSAAVAAAAVLLGAAISAVFIPAMALGLPSLVAAVSLLILLGAGVFEKMRQSNALPASMQGAANKAHALVFEFFSVAACAFLYPAALFSSDPKPPFPKGQRPVLFVHGYLHNASAWLYVKARFKHAHIGPLYTINLGNPLTFKSIEEYADMVRQKVAAIVKETGCDQVALVGHSMGGGWYVQRRQPPEKMRIRLAR